MRDTSGDYFQIRYGITKHNFIYAPSQRSIDEYAISPPRLRQPFCNAGFSAYYSFQKYILTTLD